MAKWLGGSKESGLGVALIGAGAELATRDRTPSRHDPCPCNSPDLRELITSLGVRWHEGAGRYSQVISFFPTPPCPLSHRRLTLTSTLLGGHNSVASSTFDTVLALPLFIVSLQCMNLRPYLNLTLPAVNVPRMQSSSADGFLLRNRKMARIVTFISRRTSVTPLPRTALSPQTRKTTVIAKRLRAIVDVATGRRINSQWNTCADAHLLNLLAGRRSKYTLPFPAPVPIRTTPEITVLSRGHPLTMTTFRSTIQGPGPSS
ncbi:hypothetical protein DFP72DRAFT_1075684 [Ephemerocybe angulata]|uniref:Uncharacterized protein n=1 Tax=Ephemerocybe angulata TaxID=980116 RepID=A0A8H6HIL7_9AGAR|nr:hypothetical protein DFP72DRAFT_1075684 [Tulosesus angulatus]